MPTLMLVTYGSVVGSRLSHIAAALHSQQVIGDRVVRRDTDITQ